ncbi:hypothetical protein DSM100685_0380 [Bifidobacterium avesanii]|nr:hypothetical protein DSM100685_0380 [Bifidobacterium avesanii]
MRAGGFVYADVATRVCEPPPSAAYHTSLPHTTPHCRAPRHVSPSRAPALCKSCRTVRIRSDMRPVYARFCNFCTEPDTLECTGKRYGCCGFTPAHHVAPQLISPRRPHAALGCTSSIWQKLQNRARIGLIFDCMRSDLQLLHGRDALAHGGRRPGSLCPGADLQQDHRRGDAAIVAQRDVPDEWRLACGGRHLRGGLIQRPDRRSTRQPAQQPGRRPG